MTTTVTKKELSEITSFEVTFYSITGEPLKVRTYKGKPTGIRINRLKMNWFKSYGATTKVLVTKTTN